MLPLAYRAWAKARAKKLRCWLEATTDLLVGTRQEAEYQAAILATTLSLGRATGEGAGAVAVDFTKAYDGLDLRFLEAAPPQSRRATAGAWAVLRHVPCRKGGPHR